jgi:uncharacterized membrane protein YagU involved in acid resistance
MAGVVAGIAAAAVMAALVLAMNAPTLAVAIPSLYTLAPPANVGAGLAVHLSHGAVLGVVFAGVVDALDPDSTTIRVGAGIGWGVVTWVVLAGVVMPAWLAAIGSPASPPLPNFAPPSLLWHAVYGAVLGGVYTVADDRL